MPTRSTQCVGIGLAGSASLRENRVIEYPYPVVATAPDTIDCARGRLLIGGVDRTSELVSREWHKIPPRAGFVPVVQALAPATGWVDVTARSTYI